ncbi:MAG: patatin-like phospholipase family protein [Deltaproteobacteria bacterium]|nr:patatin-like phospholipase family protein [Deltaproteobacteria bacterium]
MAEPASSPAAAATPARRPVRAIVLSGGGARGAYEAGVLRYLLDELPKRLGRQPRLDVVCGTSVGAIHACFLAATAHQVEGRGERLASVWQSFRLAEVLPVSTSDLFRLPRRLLGLGRVRAELRSGGLPARLYGLLDTSSLENVVRSAVPWRNIRANLKSGRVDAVCVAATEIPTGNVVCFVERRDRTLPPWSRDVTIVSRPARLLSEHALASAAIPMLFPAVRIGSTYYADGGLRMNTPLSPAIHLGADRILVIALRAGPAESREARLANSRVSEYGNPVFLFGKVLNSLLLDHIDTDLARMRVLNELIREGEKAFGPQFLERVNAVAEQDQRHAFRRIDDLVIRPSADVGLLAGSVLAARRAAGKLTPLLRLFLRSISASGVPSEADLLSYLLFDEEYAAPMIELGMADARAREEDLMRFFSDA